MKTVNTFIKLVVVRGLCHCFSISALFPCEISTVIISNTEKATLTCCAIFGAVEQKTGMGLEWD